MKNDCTQQMKKEIEEISGIGLTTDSWTSLGTQNYITYPAHYKAREWKLKSRVISTQYSKERHTAENVAENMKKNLMQNVE